MAFIFSKTSPATGAVAWYTFKELLKTAGWTVPSSSDGTTYNSSGDQITSGASGAGGFANNSAWFRLRDPSGIKEITIQRGTNNSIYRIKYSFLAKFSGGSPSATQTPSATDEFIALGTGTDASPGYSAWFGTDGTYRWNVGADNASPYGFWAGSFSNGGGVSPATGIVLDPLTGTAATDGHVHLFYVSSSSPFQVANLCSESFANTNRRVSTVPAASPSTTMEYHGLYYITPSGQVIPSNIGTNPLNSKDETFPIIWARRSALANPGYKGVSTIMKYNGTTRSIGDTFTVNTTRDRIIYGDINLPWDGSVPTV